MTAELRSVLMNILKDAGGEYTILTIEYPCNEHGGLKTVTRQIESDHCDVDIYNAEGQTIEYRTFFARVEP